ncbi:MAG: polymerase subunit delta [Solirubrobacteraceae bacterium]|jgi:DNA polymerase-3 subunit delta'|nr:polymerase subunit delta [Solirubrobacteraceae bacterium]
MTVTARSAEQIAARAAQVLPGIDAHAHARAVLGAALPPDGAPSHAYLFHGPHGAGKRTIARAFAAALLADGSQDPAAAAERARRGSHPDLTWVAPSGAAEMLVSDIEEPVVAAAARTPFESRRRVFVIESVERMNEQAANRMLKTLEEPPRFAHLLLLSDRREDVLATIASRCQHVRFDPLAPARIAELVHGVSAETAQACARLSLGDAGQARALASEEGKRLRATAEGFVRSAIAGTTAQRAWIELLDLAKTAGTLAGERAREHTADELELLPARERKRHQREALESARRGERRERTRALDLALGLVELWLRDLLCMCEGAPELLYAVDRRAELEQDARGHDGATLRRAVELAADARLSLSLNVSEELALEALSYRLQRTLAA